MSKMRKLEEIISTHEEKLKSLKTKNSNLELKTAEEQSLQNLEIKKLKTLLDWQSQNDPIPKIQEDLEILKMVNENNMKQDPDLIFEGLESNIREISNLKE